MSDEKHFSVNIEHLEDYQFKVEFEKESMGTILTDETEDVGGGARGPPPSRLLAAATLNCLMASLIFCLSKKRVGYEALKGEIEGTVDRVDGRWRVTTLDVDITLNIDEEDKKKLDKCLDIFEDYCIVTQSVTNGIDVNVNVEPEV
ncbi:MAG: OsmC family protein [Thermoplasmata archaeon]